VVRAAEPQALFDQSALEAIRRSRFEPFERDDVRVKQRALLRVKYELAN
jgi:outer membrane biosynthesis protein TonB